MAFAMADAVVHCCGMHRWFALSRGKTVGWPWLGRLLALAALAVQLAAASVVPASAGAVPGLGLAAPICHAGGTAGAGDGAPARHHSHDCMLCPLCQVLAQAGTVLGPATTALPAPSGAHSRVVVLPPTRAPPPRFADAAPYSTGPPNAV